MILSVRLNEKEEIFLEEIKKYYNSLEITKIKQFKKSDVIKFLLFQEYESIKKQVGKL